MSEFTTWLKNRDRKMYSEMAFMLGDDDTLSALNQEVDQEDKENMQKNMQKYDTMIRNMWPEIEKLFYKTVDTKNDIMFLFDFTPGGQGKIHHIGNIGSALAPTESGHIGKLLNEPKKTLEWAQALKTTLEDISRGDFSIKETTAERLKEIANQNRRDKNYKDRLALLVTKPLRQAYLGLSAYYAWQP
jgi:hypothetical protein